MKKVIAIITVVLLNTNLAKAQHIPDDNFAKGIRHYCSECIDSNNNLLPAAKTLVELRACMDEIKDVTGISGFSGLQILALNMDKISSLPDLPPNLTELDVSFNEDLTALPQLPVSLKKLDIQHTLISELPANLPPELEYLKCSHTAVKKLPKLPASLKDLYIQETQITSLSQLPDKLETLVYNDTYIHCIPCKNTQLTVIEAGINKYVTPVFCKSDDISNTKKNTEQTIQEIKKCISGNCNNGIGALETDNSEGHITYKGSFKNSLYNGQGSIIVKDKYKYTGSFKDGNLDGKGTFTSIDNGFVYTGAFKNNEREGFGTLVFKDGKKSVGVWKESRLWSGTGFFRYGDSDSYYGAVKENLPDGQGVFTYSNGKKFTGTFSKGNPVNGKGYFYFSETKVSYEGTLINGKYNGPGTYTNPEGQVFTGNFTDDKFNGYGKWTSPNGSKYEGNFTNGNFDGYGVMTYNDDWLYKGNWINSKRNGKGSLYNAKGELKYNGEWNNGEMANPENIISTEINVGDKKDGGIVYWVDVSGKHGLIADVDDLGEYEWKDAIRACNALGNGWHLPDRTELERLYENKNVVAKFSTGYGFSNGYYWSSSEVVYEGYGINFGNGNGTTLNGGVHYYVRAVKSF